MIIKYIFLYLYLIEYYLHIIKIFTIIFDNNAFYIIINLNPNLNYLKNLLHQILYFLYFPLLSY